MHAFRIGKLFGIDIRVDWSWVFIFLLMTWNLSTLFARWHPEWSTPGHIGLAVTASVLFFGCILAHELAHSVVALRFGLRVRSITLYLFGGVSNIEQEPPTPKVELLTAIVGPITSLLLGVGFASLGSLLTAFTMRDADSAESAAAHLGPLATLLVWLGPINMVIGFFNLVPAFPLDGGRVLRSILWALSGNLRTATLRVSAIGQVIGWVFIVTGIAMSFGAKVPFFGMGVGSGLWLAFVGWFIRNGASQAHRRLTVDEALADRTVSELMRKNGPSVSPDLPLSTLVHDYLVPLDEGALPVVQDGRLVGLISLANLCSIPSAEWPDRRVGSAMQPMTSLVVASPDEPLAEALQKLTGHDLEQLPVLADPGKSPTGDDGKLLGMLRRRDIARRLEHAWQPTPPQGSRPTPGDAAILITKSR
jgi:Zn-dependent protease/CBS domain-containing protein